MSNHPSAPQTTTDRPTATYPTDPAAIWADPAGYPTDWLADRTPTATYPTGYPQAAPFVRTNGPQNEVAIQDMWRPRRLPAWHPSLMQLAIGAALVLALLGACNVAAIQAHRQARAYCHALVVSDWSRAERECRGTGEGTPQPEQVPGAPSQPATPPPTDAPSRPEQPPAPAQQSPASPVWTVHGTDFPYDRTDPSASPLDLPRCTTSPGTPRPCLAHVSADSAHVTVLEEDASLTGLDRR